LSCWNLWESGNLSSMKLFLLKQENTMVLVIWVDCAFLKTFGQFSNYSVQWL
jgi:hypothetical protein